MLSKVGGWVYVARTEEDQRLVRVDNVQVDRQPEVLCKGQRVGKLKRLFPSCNAFIVLIVYLIFPFLPGGNHFEKALLNPK